MSDGETVLALSGDVDVRRRDELDEMLDRYGDAEPLVLDMSCVQAIDTSALRSLERFQRARREAGKSPLVLAAPSGFVRNVLQLTKLENAFEIRESV